MNLYQQKLKDYLKENPFDGGRRDVKSAIDFLVASYMEENPVSGEEIQAVEREMAPYFEQLPLQGSDRLFMLVYQLCGAYEREALKAGIMIGLHFREEMEEGE